MLLQIKYEMVMEQRQRLGEECSWRSRLLLHMEFVTASYRVQWFSWFRVESFEKS